MYGYSEHLEITFGQLLQKISQEEIFELVFNEPIIEGFYYKSPLRVDNNPGARFEYYDGTLLFIDFGDKEKTHRNCLQVIRKYFKLSYNEALRFICSKLNLSENSEDYEKEEESFTGFIEKKKFEIDFRKREFSKFDIKFWSKSLISLQNLEDDGVFSVQSYKLNGRGYTPFDLCYAITLPKSDRVKLYQPNKPKDKFKWITNFTNNDIGNLQGISKSGKKLVIASSYKDHRVIRNLEVKDVLWFQNEGQIPADIINIELVERFEEIIFFYDNDLAGLEASAKLVATYNQYRKNCARAVSLPLSSPWKDPSQFIYKEGKRDLIQEFKSLNLY